MSEKEKIELLEEIMDLEQGVLTIDDYLKDYDEWDSLSVLAYISTVNDRFGKIISGSDVKAFVTVSDAISVME